ncbi:hypothetical protein [Bradyrhizobium embrapense]|uniref:hypothetical protein n=1 Tax=Bradyrhizobium embrapense TaxID=630921 RepID=UPI00067A8614|nr:hypothetical protein [Bradyrhizobium embrapense]
MADVTGPISTLPGSGHRLPDGTMCDRHPDRPAVARIQGETDSFGSEMNDLCTECLEAQRVYARSPEARTGRCDWCKTNATDLSNTRDIDEGSAGPVYRVCGGCKKKQDDAIREELDRYDREHGPLDDGYDDYDD